MTLHQIELAIVELREVEDKLMKLCQKYDDNLLCAFYHDLAGRAMWKRMELATEATEMVAKRK